MVDFKDIPARIAKLARWRIMGADYPVPWFVQWLKDGKACDYGKGEPDFRVMDPRKLSIALSRKVCWVCGEPIGTYKAFVIGPMCTINRVSSEPPSHHDCALFSVRMCPFLTKPRMRRNEKGMPLQTKEAAGFMIERNPGVACVWVTKSFKIFNPKAGGKGILMSIGDPTNILWFAEGKPATRDQIMASIDGGYPELVKLAKHEGAAAMKELEKARERALQLVPT
jgi:hypothetical protein